MNRITRRRFTGERKRKRLSLLVLAAAVALGASALVPLAASGGTNGIGFRFGDFSCRALIKVGSGTVVSNPQVRPCEDDEETALTAGGGGLSAHVLRTMTDTNILPGSFPAAGDRAIAKSFADQVKLGSTTIDDARAVATTGCRINGQGQLVPMLKSETSVKSIQFGSAPPIHIGTAHVHFPVPFVGTLHLNHHETFVNEFRSVTIDRAVWLQGGGVIVEAQADFHNFTVNNGFQATSANNNGFVAGPCTVLN